ncbi:hypothetical protein T10_5459 [Trichinella papuae]|uniref:Uncharacterized protein n=1 Tax=Trichinella papuae TaxID=268474 RepID=A0A0V1N225_9BILA|nr:hypothetical protein T10_5459 [Trichinella papuae]
MIVRFNDQQQPLLCIIEKFPVLLSQNWSLDHLKFNRLFLNQCPFLYFFVCLLSKVRRKNACRASTKENWQHPLV